VEGWTQVQDLYEGDRFTPKFPRPPAPKWPADRVPPVSGPLLPFPPSLSQHSARPKVLMEGRPAGQSDPVTSPVTCVWVPCLPLSPREPGRGGGLVIKAPHYLFDPKLSILAQASDL